MEAEGPIPACVCVVGSKEFARKILSASGLAGTVTSLHEAISKYKIIIKSKILDRGWHAGACLVGIESDGFEAKKYAEHTMLIAGGGNHSVDELEEAAAAVVRDRVSKNFFVQMAIDGAVDKACADGDDVAVVSGLNRTSDLDYFRSLDIPVIFDDAWMPSPDFKPTGVTVSMGDQDNTSAIKAAGTYLRSLARIPFV